MNVNNSNPPRPPRASAIAGSRTAGTDKASKKKARFAPQDSMATFESHEEKYTSPTAAPDVPSKAEHRVDTSTAKYCTSKDGRVTWPNGQQFDGRTDSKGRPNGGGKLTMPGGGYLDSAWKDGVCVRVSDPQHRYKLADVAAFIGKPKGIAGLFKKA